LCERISELTGAPVVSTIRSVREAIEESGAASIGVITPYVDELNERIRASIEADGIQVAGITGLGITDNFAIAEVGHDEIVAFAERALGPLAAGGGIGLAFASCTNFGAMAARPAIAERLGLPVVTSNQAVLAAAVARLQTLAA
jgi:maleate isomerase